MQQAVLECAKNGSMIMGTSQKLSSLDNDPCMTSFKLILNDHEIRRVKKKTKYLGLIIALHGRIILNVSP